MFVPLHDDNPLKFVVRPYVTWALIAVNLLVFLLVQHGGDGEVDMASAMAYGTIPAVLGKLAILPMDIIHLPPELTLLTYMFLHGGWMHLIGNMAFLWVFGDNIEDAMGHLRFLVFYLACGVIAGIVYALALPASETPLVGASGAVAGIISAYLVLHPRIKLWVLVLMRLPLRINAAWALGAWIAFQWVNLLLSGADDATAWWAHIGGLVAGAVLVVPLRRRGVPLFDRAPSQGAKT